MKTAYTLMLCTFFALRVQGQNIFLTENFNYPADSLLQNNGWFAHSAGGTNPIKVTNGGLSLANTSYLGNNIGNAAAVNNTGSDENKPFTSYVDSGNVYVSFLMKVNGAVTSGNSGFFLHIGEYTNTTTPVFTSVSTAFRARTFIAPGPTAAQYKLGLSFNAATVSSDTTALNLDTAQTYLVVLKYQFVTGPLNDSVSLYVFPAGSNIATEPATPAIGPLAGTAADLSIAQLVALRQYNANQNITVDGIIAQDSWNLLAPSLIGPSLIGPANGTLLNISGSSTTVANINWTAAQNATSAPSYSWQLASRTAGNFNAPLLSIPANNNSADTSLSLTFAQIDAALASLGVPIGDTVKGIWRVRAISGTDTAFSNVFDIDIRRGNFTVNLSAFNLLAPPNFTILPITGAGTQTTTIRWSASTAGVQAVTYDWLAIAPGGNFNAPVVTLASGNAGNDTALTLSYADIDALLASLNFNIGDSIFLDWTVRATSGTQTQLANQTWRITLFRGGLSNPIDSLSAFSLLSPPNNTILTVQGDPTQTANINWEASTASLNTATTSYTWLLDSPTGDFSNPLLTIVAGTATSISLPYGTIIDSLAAKGINVSDSLIGKWTVLATNDTLNRLASTPFNITIIRGVMSSVFENDFSKAITIYPNPANSNLNMKFNTEVTNFVRISILNVSGNELKSFEAVNTTELASLSVSDLSNGMYFVKIQSESAVAIKRFLVQR